MISLVQALAVIILFSLLSCEPQNEEKDLICLTPDEYKKLILTSPPNFKIKLPSSKPTQTSNNNSVNVSVSHDNNYYVNDSAVTYENIESKIMSQVAETGDSIIELRGDKASSWGANVKIIDIAKSNQLKIVIKTGVK